MRVDDDVEQLLEPEAGLLLPPRSVCGVAQQPRAVPGPQAAGIADQRVIQLPAIPVPQVRHEFIRLRGRETKRTRIPLLCLGLRKAPGLDDAAGINGLPTFSSDDSQSRRSPPPRRAAVLDG